MGVNVSSNLNNLFSKLSGISNVLPYIVKNVTAPQSFLFFLPLTIQ